jgi:hypothetical protein
VPVLRRVRAARAASGYNRARQSWLVRRRRRSPLFIQDLAQGRGSDDKIWARRSPAHIRQPPTTPPSTSTSTSDPSSPWVGVPSQSRTASAGTVFVTVRRTAWSLASATKRRATTAAKSSVAATTARRPRHPRRPAQAALQGSASRRTTSLSRRTHRTKEPWVYVRPRRAQDRHDTLLAAADRAKVCHYSCTAVAALYRRGGGGMSGRGHRGASRPGRGRANYRRPYSRHRAVYITWMIALLLSGCTEPKKSVSKCDSQKARDVLEDVLEEASVNEPDVTVDCSLDLPNTPAALLIG